MDRRENMASVGAPPVLSNPPQDGLGPSLRTATWLMAGLSFLFLCTRLYCKYSRHRKLQADDMVLIVSWLCLLIPTIGVTLEVQHGFGQHSYLNPPLTPSEIDTVAMTGLICITLTIMSGALSKTSWGITLLQVTTGRMRKFIWFAIISMNLLCVPPALLWWLQCRPIEKAWHPLIAGTCPSAQTGVVLGIVASCYSGIMDLTFAIIPWQILRALQIRPEEKFGIAVAMSMGLFAAVSAFIKAAALPEILSPDFSYTGVPLTLWGGAEIAVSIMAASVPMMRVLVQSVRNKHLSRDMEADLPNGTPMETTSVESSRV